MDVTKWSRLAVTPVLAIGLGVGIWGCDVEQTEEGRAPSVDVRDTGELPDVDVNVRGGRSPDVAVDPGKLPRADVDVNVPDVDVDAEINERPDADTAARSGTEMESTDTDLDRPAVDTDVDATTDLDTRDDINEVEAERNPDGTVDVDVDR